ASIPPPAPGSGPASRPGRTAPGPRPEKIRYSQLLEVPLVIAPRAWAAFEDNTDLILDASRKCSATDRPNIPRLQKQHKYKKNNNLMVIQQTDFLNLSQVETMKSHA